MKRHGSSVSSRIGRALCAILTLACLCISNFALTLSTATLTGRVTDSNAAAIVGAKVDANNIDTNLTFSTVTNNEGLFVIPNLPPGRYRIFVQKDGFTAITRPNVILHVQDIISLSFSMQPGSVIQSMTVEGGAPLIQKESATVGTVVDRQFVENLPLNGRSFQSLIALTPGVVLTKTSSGEQGQFSVNGQRANANYFMVDGVSANAGVAGGGALVQSAGGALPAFSAAGGTNSLVSVDAMQEFRIQTSTFAPEFGRTPGAQIQILTRSGTNEFHGSLFDYFRNDALDANDWFANNQGLPKSALRQNDFGGVLGGPIIKNKTFFFFSYEGLRLRQPQTQVTLVPSVASRQAAVPQMRPFLNAYPAPNGQVFANGVAEFSASYSDQSTLNATSVRVDHTFGNKLTLFGRYNYAPSDTIQRGGSGASLNSLDSGKLKTQTLTFGATQVFSPTVSNELRANYTKSEAASVFSIDDLGGAVPPPDSLLFPSFTSREESLFSFFPFETASLSVGRNAANVQRQFNLINNLSIVRGKHLIKIGADYRLLLPITGPRLFAQFAILSIAAARSGMAEFVEIDAGEQVFLSVTNVSAYGQDTWKPTPRLALTYGLRWDLNPAPKGRKGTPLFTILNPTDPAAISYAPDGTPLYETRYNNFAPRLGVAYQLSQRNGWETSLRGGFGIFYDLGTGSIGNSSAGLPYGRIGSFFDVPFPLTPAQLVPPPFSLDPPTSGTAFIANPNLKVPRTYQWNFAVEQSLGSNQTVSATYVGAVGRDLLRLRQLAPLPSLTLNLMENTATSDYHALQLQFQRRLSKGLQALASYSWAHSIDISSADSFFGGTNANPRLDRGNSDFDVRHTFNGAVTYDLPSPDVGAFGNAIIRNWSVDAILTARSATPVNIFADFDFTGGVSAFLRPDIVPGAPLYADDPSVAGGRRFNPAAFAPPPAGRQGTLGRNVLRGFSAVQVDMAVRRQFSLTERLKLQLRAEAFNIFNHPNFGDPSGFAGAFLTSSLFGRSTQMLGKSLGAGGTSGGFNPLYQIGGPRSMQLALKLTF